MKWKTMLVMLLAIAMAGCQVTMVPTDPKAIAKAEKKKVQAETIERIRQYELARQEQQLIFDILKLRNGIAAFQKAPTPEETVVVPSEVKE